MQYNASSAGSISAPSLNKQSGSALLYQSSHGALSPTCQLHGPSLLPPTGQYSLCGFIKDFQIIYFPLSFLILELSLILLLSCICSTSPTTHTGLINYSFPPPTPLSGFLLKESLLTSSFNNNLQHLMGSSFGSNEFCFNMIR